MVYGPASKPINQVTLGVPECTVVLVIYYLSLRRNAHRVCASYCTNVTSLLAILSVLFCCENTFEIGEDEDKERKKMKRRRKNKRGEWGR